MKKQPECWYFQVNLIISQELLECPASLHAFILKYCPYKPYKVTERAKMLVPCNNSHVLTFWKDNQYSPGIFQPRPQQTRLRYANGYIFIEKGYFLSFLAMLLCNIGMPYTIGKLLSSTFQ